jgi:glycosyltransferase involved in cell wall biosynthesis
MVAVNALRRIHGQVTRVSSSAIGLSHQTIGILGELDESFDSLQGFADDVACRVLSLGMSLKVVHDTTERQPEPPVHELVRKRYPWLNAPDGPPSWLAPKRAPMDPVHAQVPKVAKSSSPSVLVDMRGITTLANGTGQHSIRTIEGLSRQIRNRFALLVSDTQEQLVRDLFDRFAIEVLIGEDTSAHPEFDIAFRPHQFESGNDVRKLHRFANKVVVSHLDFIAFNNPTYHPSPSQWYQRRQATLEALNLVDGIAWLSNSVRSEAIDLGVDLRAIPNETCGVVIRTPERNHTEQTPSRVAVPYIAVVGASYNHKNRPYAIRLLDALLRLEWNGNLILAGWDPPFGSSRMMEEHFLTRNEHLRARVNYLDQQRPDALVEVIGQAECIIHPSVEEGFGMLPFESALLGTPTLLARRSALRETVSNNYIGQLSFDPDEDAHRFIEIRSGSSRSNAIDSLARVAQTFDESSYTSRLLRLFDQVDSRG